MKGPMTFSEHANDQLCAQFAAWQAEVIIGDPAQIEIARAAMGGALVILRLHYADDRLFYSIAQDPLGLSRHDVDELIEFANGNGSEQSAIPV